MAAATISRGSSLLSIAARSVASSCSATRPQTAT
jgi:hypothetical protein